MLLWIVMAVLTAAASLSILVPLSRPRRAGSANQGAARSIYHDQLDEVARDRERGLIGPAEAEAARVEVARRLLHADATLTEAEEAVPRAPLGQPRAAFIFAVILLPLIAIGTYLRVGSPTLEDQPLAARASTAPSDIADLVKQVETHLAQKPEDGSGWEVIGPIYLRLDRADDAVRAFTNAIRLLGSTPARQSLLGEALTEQAGGVVNPAAAAAFEQATATDPNNDRARFYLALRLGQQGRKDEALAAWDWLIATAPKNAGWLAVAEAERAGLKGAATPPSQPGPSAADVADAARQSPEARQQMIEGMVAGLAARLDAAPDDAGGWARLLSAYMVLGRPDDAKAALARAQNALAAKPETLAAVEQAARASGVRKD